MTDSEKAGFGGVPVARRAWGFLRQLSFPKEFRIAPAAWQVEWWAPLEELVSRLERLEEARSVAADTKDEPDLDHARSMADIGTGLWRARKTAVDRETGAPREGMERVFNHLQSVFDALETQGVHVKDHTGERWVDGRFLSVVAFQPMPELTEEVITDTIRPSIFIGDHHIQEAQVIVGTPPEEGQQGADEGTAHNDNTSEI